MFLYKVDEAISLRLIDLEDAEQIFERVDQSRNHLRRWMAWVDGTTSAEDIRTFLKGTMEGYAQHRSLTTVILYHEKIAGTAGYNSINWSNKTAYIGYWLGEKFQGKGIMTQAVKVLTDYAFHELNLNKVEIRAASANRRSRNIPERLGFVNEGCIRQAEWLYDHYVDHVVYGMLAAEWEAKKI